MGELVQFNAYLAQLTWPILGLGWVMALYQRGLTSLRRLFELLDEKPAIRDEDPLPLALEDLSGRCALRGWGSSGTGAGSLGASPSRSPKG